MYNNNELPICKRSTTYEKSFQKILVTYFEQPNASSQPTNLLIVFPNINTTIYGSNSTMTLKAIKQWNELQNFIKTDFFSPEMTYILLFQTLKVKFINVGLKPSYIENQWTKTSNYFYYHNTFSAKLTSHLLLIKLLHAMFWYS